MIFTRSYGSFRLQKLYEFSKWKYEAYLNFILRWTCYLYKTEHVRLLECVNIASKRWCGFNRSTFNVSDLRASPLVTPDSSFGTKRRRNTDVDLGGISRMEAAYPGNRNATFTTILMQLRPLGTVLFHSYSDVRL